MNPNFTELLYINLAAGRTSMVSLNRGIPSDTQKGILAGSLRVQDSPACARYCGLNFHVSLRHSSVGHAYIDISNIEPLLAGEIPANSLLGRFYLNVCDKYSAHFFNDVVNAYLAYTLMHPRMNSGSIPSLPKAGPSIISYFSPAGLKLEEHTLRKITESAKNFLVCLIPHLLDVCKHDAENRDIPELHNPEDF